MRSVTTATSIINSIMGTRATNVHTPPTKYLTTNGMLWAMRTPRIVNGPPEVAPFGRQRRLHQQLVALVVGEGPQVDEITLAILVADVVGGATDDDSERGHKEESGPPPSVPRR